MRYGSTIIAVCIIALSGLISAYAQNQFPVAWANEATLVALVVSIEATTSSITTRLVN